MKRLISITLILAITVIATPADARRDRADGGSQRAERGGEAGLTAGQAAAKARRQTGGRVLSVKPSGGGYQVRVLTPGGEVRQVFVSGGGR